LQIRDPRTQVNTGKVFRQQVIDGLLLSTIDPTSEDQEQELPPRFHISPDAR
jgi:hypothetical protein